MAGADGAGSSDSKELLWLKVAFVVNIVAFATAILLIQLDPLQSQANRGYFDSPKSELGPDPHPFLNIPTLDDAIDIANRRLQDVAGEEDVPFDRGDEDFAGELIWDHEAGNIYYWELSQDEFTMAIDATSGDVVDFSWYRDQGDGNLTREQAWAIAMRYIELFGGLPYDASPPSIEYVHRGTHLSYNETTGEIFEIERCDWFIESIRFKDGIPTDDRIWVSLDLDGSSDFYYKVWNMHLGSVDTRQKMSYEDALSIARSVANGANITSIERRIVRPIGGWLDEPDRFGTEPVCVWRVTFEYCDLTYLARIDIDDRTTEIVGSDWYF